MLKARNGIFPNVIHIKSKSIDNAVELMRPSRKITRPVFRQQWEIIFNELLSAYFDNLGVRANNVGVTVILRAGLAGFLAMKERLLNTAMPVFPVWANRDEVSIKADILRCNIPDQAPMDGMALVLDPMCATGTSSDTVITQLKECGYRDITVIFGVASPEGLKTISDHHLDAKIIVGFTGSHLGLNSRGYVIYLDTNPDPELCEAVIGDAGDLWMGITSKRILLA